MVVKPKSSMQPAMLLPDARVCRPGLADVFKKLEKIVNWSAIGGFCSPTREVDPEWSNGKQCSRCQAANTETWVCQGKPTNRVVSAARAHQFCDITWSFLGVSVHHTVRVEEVEPTFCCSSSAGTWSSAVERGESCRLSCAIATGLLSAAEVVGTRPLSTCVLPQFEKNKKYVFW